MSLHVSGPLKIGDRCFHMELIDRVNRIYRMFIRSAHRGTEFLGRVYVHTKNRFI